MLLNKSRAKQLMDYYKVDCLIATTPANVSYASGYGAPYTCVSDIEFLVILPKEENITPVVVSSKISSDLFLGAGSWIEEIRLYGEFFIYEFPEINKEHLTDIEKRQYRLMREVKTERTQTEALLKALEERGLTDARIGLDEKNLSPQEFDHFKSALPQAKIVPGHHIFRMIRMVKTDEAIEKLRKAALINQKGMEAVLKALRVGITERELYAIFEEEVRREGGIPYHGIFKFGTRGSLPTGGSGHTDDRLKNGEGVKLDSDTIFADHYADMALTASMGKPSKKLMEYYRGVYSGLQEAERVIKPGITAAEVFNATLDAVRKNGIPHYGRHHVGHGLGLECYDLPLITPKNETILEQGTVFNIEVPYYEIGWGCVHAENTFVVTKTGCERFQNIDMELKVI